MSASPASLSLPERLTHGEASACLQALQAQASGAGPVSIDASALKEFDSAALSTLLALRRWARSQGRDLRVLRMPPRLAELVALYGVGELLAA